ncbi:2-hydroxychromene-2-carboxylate isomerase [Sandaracinus amylolyticus]|uniref:2-hydroxychromene-2-carboxylate isomerase n=1 Tax=Sandaracinus amylolyticus TaxID=927083 RepID=A0A0F6YH92_9BACT|nr:2-hydroxychromene-2-carboxylate isomerase [Sandaracinus amylolyticus]AKF05476.1 2-hydroxychromene-2-carboxylate isomerase [Sandaracinus amylolyticus]
MIDLNSKTVECWFDYSSPFAYLGTTQIERVAREHGARVAWRPFLLGALFKQIGTPLVPLESFGEAKRRHARIDLERWADHWGVPFRFTSRFPLRTVDALRVTLLLDDALSLEGDRRASLVHAIMRACWVEDRDPADPDVLRACLREASLDPALLDRAGDAKQTLFDATTRAMEIGAPGAPCFVVGNQLFWGQDRLDFVGKALAGWRVPAPGSRVSGST